MPWLVWLSGLSTGLQTQRLLVLFPIRAHSWGVSQVPSWEPERGNPSMILFMMIFLPFSFSPFSPFSNNN